MHAAHDSGEEPAEDPAEAAADGEGGDDAEEAGDDRHEERARRQREGGIDPRRDALHGGDRGDVQGMRERYGEADTASHGVPWSSSLRAARSQA